MSEQPHSAASAGARVDPGHVAAVVDDERLLPPAPTLGVVAHAFVAGAFVVVGVTIDTVCAAAWLTEVLPSAADRGQYAVVGGIAFVIVFVAIVAWWHALRDASADKQRWVGLSFPFFAVVGAAAGLAFFAAAYPDEDEMFPHRSRRACERVTGIASGPTLDRCLPRADACQLEVIARGGSLDDVDACLKR